MRWMSIGFLMWVGCGGDAGSSDATILALGDSIMAWNAEDKLSIPDVVGEVLGQVVQNNAVSGAYISSDEGDVISDQYEEGDWSWVILDGGGNDVNDECDCGDCLENIDTMISEDGTSGEWVNFIEGMLEAGSKVALMSYYAMPAEAEFGFNLCNEEVEITRSRYQALADRHDGMILVDAANVVDPERTPEAYDDDFVHPSPVGSRLIGAYFAERMSAQ